MVENFGSPWIVIAIPSGDSEIPRKYLRLLDGKSLLERAIETAKSALAANPQPGQRILVLSPDQETLRFGEQHQVQCVSAPAEITTFSSLLGFAGNPLRELGAVDADAVVAFDPALAFLSSARILEAAESLHGEFRSVSLDTNHQKVAGFAASKLSDVEVGMAGAPTAFLEASEPENIQVTTFATWAMAEHWATRRRIFIRTDLSEVLDASHAQRSLALAQALARHEVSIVITEDQAESASYFANQGFEVIQVADDLELLALARKEKADLVVLDRHLNTTEFVTLLGGFCKVVTIEDLGAAAIDADLVVNAMFEHPRLAYENQLTGAENMLLPDSFEALPKQSVFEARVKKIIVSFGGSDHQALSHLALKALEQIQFGGEIILVRGLGSDLIDPSVYDLRLKIASNPKDVAGLFQAADLAIASSDYQLSLLVAVGVPTIALARNASELTHTLANFKSGVLTLGLGNLLTVDSLAAHIDRLIEDIDMREGMHHRALAAMGRRSNRVVSKNLLRRLGF